MHYAFQTMNFKLLLTMKSIETGRPWPMLSLMPIYYCQKYT